MDKIVKPDTQTLWIKEAHSMNFDAVLDLGWCGRFTAACLKCGPPLVIIAKCFSFSWVLSLSLLPSLSFFCSFTPQRNRAADPGPLCAPPTCSRGHRWLKRWQVDSTLKLSIDPWEPNQTANPPSLSARSAQRHRGKGSSEAERAASTSAPSAYVAARCWEEPGAALEGCMAPLMWFQADVVDSSIGRPRSMIKSSHRVVIYGPPQTQTLSEHLCSWMFPSH